jgi:hypothetical protein
MTDFRVVSASQVEDGVAVWLTDKHTRVGALAQTQPLARPRTLLGRLSQNRQA